MAKRYITISDLSGKEIPDEERAEVRVLSHPTLESPVKLDAQALEIQSLLNKNQDLVILELVLPGDDQPVRVLSSLKDFDKIFLNNVDDVLGSAERYITDAQEEEAPRRRGRPPGAATKAKVSAGAKAKRDPDLLNQIRSWARENGWPDLGNRGRIPAAAEQAWEAAHAS